ncbi:MAG: hypothetical protein JXA82_03505 [Sedimentisphaerales bacterium]|nr:hypothetical protein [Sedimentisphaerales bacterium]
MEGQDSLQSVKIIGTIEQLRLRILDRFPRSGLSQICTQFLTIAKETDRQIEWIERPNWFYRLAVVFIIIVAAVAFVYIIGAMELELGNLSPADLATIIDSTFNEVILIGAAVVFLVSIEVRAKRRKVVKSVNRLRCLAHIIDAHQLTKDPNIAPDSKGNTTHSPKRELSPYELNRYLDYCTELLSLVGKVGFLYVQHFNDPVAVKSVNDLESLTTGMARKIWQKIIMIRDQKNL